MVVCVTVCKEGGGLHVKEHNKEMGFPVFQIGQNGHFPITISVAFLIKPENVGLGKLKMWPVHRVKPPILERKVRCPGIHIIPLKVNIKYLREYI